jgi:MutL protein
LACSSAGGGLRVAPVGHERLVTAEAGHRVALTAGGRVVHVHAGPLDGARRPRPGEVVTGGRPRPGERARRPLPGGWARAGRGHR